MKLENCSTTLLKKVQNDLTRSCAASKPYYDAGNELVAFDYVSNKKMLDQVNNELNKRGE